MFSFFFVNLKMITVFTLLDVFCFFIYIYIYIISLPVMYSLWFAHLKRVPLRVRTNTEHEQEAPRRVEARGERPWRRLFLCFFCFAPFFFFLSVLFWTDMDLMLARETNQRCLFGLFFFPPPFVISFLYFHDLSRGSLIILLMKICSGQNIFVVIKQWTS